LLEIWELNAADPRASPFYCPRSRRATHRRPAYSSESTAAAWPLAFTLP
jgi:hypothetical protein